MRLRDIGDAHVYSSAGNAIAVRAAVLIEDSDEGSTWGGQLWPYRPLALTPGRYVLRVRGEDLGAITVHRVRVGSEREVAGFTGMHAPGEALRALFLAGGAAQAGPLPRFPRVADDVEPTALARLAQALATLLRPLRLLSRRLSNRRGWGPSSIRGAGGRQ
jgi:hypothetical protein